MDIYSKRRFKDAVSGNRYPGRGIVVGKSCDGAKAVIAYFIMGRSDNSRNRVFTEKDGSVYTEPFDPSKVEDPSLIIYAAVREFENKLIVTNGDQTDTVYEGYAGGKGFHEALRSRCFEPDAPNLTPRISAVVRFDRSAAGTVSSEGSDPEPGAESDSEVGRISGAVSCERSDPEPGAESDSEDGRISGAVSCERSDPEPDAESDSEVGRISGAGFDYSMSILKSADREGSACNRYGFDYESLPGVGHFIHTYECDGNPLPTFQGEPRRIEIPDDIDEFTDEIWEALDPENKISLYVRYTDLETGGVESRLLNKNGSQK